MVYTCADVLKTCHDANYQISVIAGSQGLNRSISWVYVADATNSLLETINWISGGELVVCTGANIVGDLESVLSEYIERGARKGIAGIVVNTGMWIPKVPNKVIQKADALGLPIMVVPWETRLVSFTKLICTSIVQQMADDESDSASSLITALLTGDALSSDIQTLAFSQPCVNAKYMAAVFDFNNSQALDLSLSRIRGLLNTAPFHSLVSFYDKHIVAILQMPENADYNSLFSYVFCRLEQDVGENQLAVGVGSLESNISDAAKSYRAALNCLFAAKAEKKPAPFFFNEIGVYELLLALMNDPVLFQYYHSLFDPLSKHPNVRGADNLFLTLIEYFSCDCVLTVAAKRLHIHENTLKYRLDKISSLIHADPRTLQGRIRIDIGIKIGRLLNLI